MTQRMTVEEIAFGFLCAWLRAGKLIGPEEIKQAFSLAMTFQDHADAVISARRAGK